MFPSKRDVRHQECATDPMPAMHEQNTSPNACVEIGVSPICASELLSYTIICVCLCIFRGQTQTIDPQSAVTGLAAVDDTLLALWLTKIGPMVERELRLGPTPLSSQYAAMFSGDSDIQAVAHQVIAMSPNRSDRDDVPMQLGCAAWMSVVTQNAPMLAVAVSPVHSAWCDHTDTAVEIYVPRR